VSIKEIYYRDDPSVTWCNRIRLGFGFPSISGGRRGPPHRRNFFLSLPPYRVFPCATWTTSLMPHPTTLRPCSRLTCQMDLTPSRQLSLGGQLGWTACGQD